MSVGIAKPAVTYGAGGIFRDPGQRKIIFGLLLVVATLAVYNPVSHNGFVNFDDDRYVTDNPQVRAGIHWSTISWAFTSLDQANWHPLTWLSHALDCQLFQLNPAGHHYTNLLLHSINTLLLFLILQWFTRYTGRSVMVAALFALHPINVETVAWIAERKNVLCMFFLLLAVAAYGWYVRQPGIGRYLLVAALFAMSLMSKPMAITLPFALLLLDYWPLGRIRFAGSEITEHFSPASQSIVRLSLEKLPLLVLSGTSALITMRAQRGGGAVLTSAAHHPLLRMENVFVSYALYVAKTFWPSHLAALYPYPHTLPMWQVVASAVFLLAATLIVLKYRSRRYLLVGWFWFLGTMVPMIGLVQVGNQAMADRYAYLPMIGLFTIIVWGTAEYAKRRHISNRYLSVVALAVLIALSAVTRVQIGFWHDDFSLWSHALAVTQNNYVAENNFAYALMKQGRADEAIVHFRTASALEPGDPASELNLGIYAQQHGDLQQAASRYELVLQLATDTQIRGAAYADLGTVYFAQRDYDRAQQNFESALKLNRVFPVMLLDMGLIEQKRVQKDDQNVGQSTAQNKLQKTTEWDRAAYYYAQFVAAEPSDVAYLLLAEALHQSGHPDEAKMAYDKAARISPDIAKAQQQSAQLAAQ